MAVIGLEEKLALLSVQMVGAMDVAPETGAALSMSNGRPVLRAMDSERACQFIVTPLLKVRREP